MPSNAAATASTNSPVDLARGANEDEPVVIPASPSRKTSKRASPPPWRPSAQVQAAMRAADAEEHQNLQEKIRLCQLQLTSYG